MQPKFTPDPLKMTNERFPHRAGVISTHYDECFKYHPDCAYQLGVEDAIAAMQSNHLPHDDLQ